MPLFMEWQEYASFRPIGERAADVRMASLLCMVANMMSKRGAPRKKIEDFMISQEPKARKTMTGDQIDAVMRAAFNKQEEGKRGKRSNSSKR
jgi:hypothetical protein